MALLIAPLSGWTGDAHAATKPNIIVIQTDDQSAETMTRRIMPNVFHRIRGHGTTFTDYVTSGPLCCPSRAVLLTGQYGHNNGVLWDNPNPYGNLVDKSNVLPVWMQRAGYRTAHVGKFLNLYGRAVEDKNEVAPGWDEWYTALDPVRYYDYVLRENGHARHYGEAPSDYLTRVLNKKAVAVIRRYVPRRRPLFMELDQFAPHASVGGQVSWCQRTATPDPRDSHLFENEPLPRPPSFDEADVSDKPGYIQAQDRLSPQAVQLLAVDYRCRLASLRAVDRGVRKIVEALKAEGELRQTAFFFTSDNGWLEGEHRTVRKKVDPYEESLHVPFAVRLPRDARPREGVPSSLRTTVANIDVAPTILRLAGASPCSSQGHCRVLDGRSMRRAIRTGGRDWPKGRGILLELKAPFNRSLPFTPCDYQGIRTSRDSYVEYHSATLEERGPCIRREEVEHYDLRADPFELDNVFPAPAGSSAAATERSLRSRVARLRDCAGIKGRDPEPASGHYCG